MCAAVVCVRARGGRGTVAAVRWRFGLAAPRAGGVWVKKGGAVMLLAPLTVRRGRRADERDVADGQT